MASILSVREIWNGRRFRLSSTLQRQFTRKFRVEVDDPSIGMSYVLFAADPATPSIYVPRVNQIMVYQAAAGETDNGSVCIDTEAEQDNENPFIFVVTCTFDSIPYDPNKLTSEAAAGSSSGGGGGGQPTIENPLQRPAITRIGSVHDTRVLDRTVEQFPRAVVNRAGQPFSPRPVVDRSRMIIQITRNELAYDWADEYLYWDSVNEASWQGFSARAVKFSHSVGDTSYENGYSFWIVTRTFETHPSGWDHTILNAGPNYKDENGVLVPFVDGGLAIAGETLLDNSGGKLPAGAAPIWLTFPSYDTIDFTTYFGF